MQKCCGKILFTLLLLSLLSEDRLGQRGMADLYASPHFRAMFNLASKRGKLSHSSLSERLSKVDVTYFKKLHALIQGRFSKLYPTQTMAGMKLQQVDSSLVADVSNRLEEGLKWVNEKKRGKSYTIHFDGRYGSPAKVHSEDRYANESLALPENVPEHFKKSKSHLKQDAVVQLRSYSIRIEGRTV
jgi:hypothetical protein